MKEPRTHISSLVADRTLKGDSPKRLGRELAAYLLEEGRVNELDSILRDVQADWAEVGIIDVVAASAHPLTPAVISDIKAQIKTIYPNAKRIIINDVIDPDVIGGVKLSLPGRQLDMSIEAKLNKFKHLTMRGKD